MGLATGIAHANHLLAVDDVIAVPSSKFLMVEPLGVLENDTLGGETVGVTSTLLSDVTKGILSCPTDATRKLCTDGSFNYVANASFDGFDTFTYQAAGGGETAVATVRLSACNKDKTTGVFTCWRESEYLTKLTELGYNDTQLFREGFEGTAWNGVRSTTTNTTTAASITSKGITWSTNFPASNGITTGSGGHNSGFWGAYDPAHGLAVLGPGNETFCNGPSTPEPPPTNCLPYDGLSGSGTGLFGVGGYFSGVIAGGSIAVILDGALTSIKIGNLATAAPQFFGVIKTTGFTTFRFQEESGKTGQENPVFGDDFIIATSNPLSPNGAPVLDPIGNLSLNENQSFSIDLTASDLDDGDLIRFDINNVPAGASFLDNVNGTATFSWQPNFNQAGSYPLTITVTDNGFPPKSASESITVTVNDVNRIPVITSTPLDTVIEGNTYSYTLTATDVDSDTLTYSNISVPALPSWLNFNAMTGELSGTAPASEIGNTINVKLQVTDGKDLVEDVFSK